MSEALVSKISPKVVCGKQEKPEGKTVVWKYQIIGIANDIKMGESNYGEWIAFLGSFKATNLETGETFRSGKCFLPQTATNLIVPALKDSKGVEFAFNVGIKKADTSIGYEYIVEPLIAASESDPLLLLEKKIPAGKLLEFKKDDGKKKSA